MTTGALSVWVSGVLRTGTLLSAAIIAVGVVAGSSPITLAGMFVLTLTPAVSLAAAAAAFARGGEPRYALIASGACALLLGALALAVAVTAGTGG
jgi:uncharacterized membrane protein